MDCFYTLQNAWPAKVETPAAIGTKLLRMLDDLEAAGGSFADWGLWAEPMELDPDFDPDDPKDAEFLEPDRLSQVRGRIARLVSANVSRDDGEEDIDSGYSIFGRSRTSSQTSRVALTVVAGSKRTNYVAMDAGSMMQAPDPSMIEFQPFKAALLAVATNWPCPWASVGAFPLLNFNARSFELPKPFDWRPIFGMAWMGYLSAERANGLVVPHELVTERLPDGGLLLVSAEEPLDADNPRHVKAAALLGDILAERGGKPAR